MRYTNLQDRNLKMLADHVLMNLFQAIERPSRFVTYNRSTKEYYKGELKWLETEKFWFACWDEFSGWHPEMLKKKIKEKIEKKLRTLNDAPVKKPKDSSKILEANKRRCPICKKVYTLSSDHFYRNKYEQKGFAYECKKCGLLRKKKLSTVGVLTNF